MENKIYTYKIRTGGIQPVVSSCPSGGIPEEYVLQTFGAEKSEVELVSAETELIRSSDLQGLKPTEDITDPVYVANTYSEASYSGKGMRNTDGDLVYTGQLKHVSVFIDEDDVPGWA